ncbi:MAG: hypothetical protein NVSMB42_12360 [Herpetosiphon sp.]
MLRGKQKRLVSAMPLPFAYLYYNRLISIGGGTRLVACPIAAVLVAHPGIKMMVVNGPHGGE